MKNNAYQEHASNNFDYYIKYCNEEYKPPVEYSGVDVPEVFYENLKEGVLYVAKEYYESIVPIQH